MRTKTRLLQSLGSLLVASWHKRQAMRIFRWEQYWLVFCKWIIVFAYFLGFGHMAMSFFSEIILCRRSFEIGIWNSRRGFCPFLEELCKNWLLVTLLDVSPHQISEAAQCVYNWTYVRQLWVGGIKNLRQEGYKTFWVRKKSLK